jgi:serine/threonine-protein kinase
VAHPDDDRTIDPSLTGAAAIGIVTPPLLTSTQFAPGSIVAGRYRLVALLGRGGMGEVYRADDLTLGQPVALKFLAAGVAVDDARLAQFHNELRIARQVSHKNVCRLYDLGDADGRRFLTMEYVDGEDLSSSLRRFGRIPPDKAIQIARQLCAGVAAAHERGVLHRDLKPANVMLDGNGDVRITDFGIATAAADTGTAIAGTPQYMAPELLGGRPASNRSDIYALGLILFEIFTGRRAYDAKTIADLKALHSTGTVTTPSSIVRDLDPAIERVILRCLEKDPDRRPASALTVAAALPGGDPLAAALAAGETPSPDMLAAAGETGALDVRWGVAALAIVAVGLLVFAGLSARTSIIGRVPLDREPAVLADRANQILASLGYAERWVDRVYGLTTADDYIDWLWNTRPDPKRWDALSDGVPAAVVFWYRTSPRPLVPLAQSSVDPENPPMTVTNMRLLLLDTQGRLQEFRSVPPQVEVRSESAEPPWSALFDAAGLQMAAFSPVASQRTPPDYADARQAWAGPLTDRPDLRVRVEAAAYRGKAVFFSIVGPWTRDTRADPEQESDVDRLADAVFIAVILALSVAAILLARHNFRIGRADRRGASRLALYIAVSGLAYWLTFSHHVVDANLEFESFLYTVAIFTLVAVLMGTIYLALEPYVRRFWPDSLLGWSRLITGHIRDPRVGRDVLTGAVFGIALGFIALGKARILPRFGYPAVYPAYGMAIDVLSAPGRLIGVWIAGAVSSLEAALLAVLVFVVLRLLLRRGWLSVGAGVVLLSLVSANKMGGAGTWLVWLFPLASGLLLTLVVVRFGVLAYAVAWYFSGVLRGIPLRLDLSHWAATPSAWTLALLMALTLFGFYASRAGQPLLGRVLSE